MPVTSQVSEAVSTQSLVIDKLITPYTDDIAHSYQFTFEPNKRWGGFYAKAEEIQNYIEGVAEKYGANRFIHLQHKVTQCVWDDSKKQW